MTEKQILLYEYEQILIGKKSAFSPYLLKYGDTYSEELGLYVIRYAVENFLQWDPYDVQCFLNRKVIEIMHLEQCVKMINFPPEISEDSDYFYIATLLYPDKIRFNTRELILRTYRNILDGNLYKFPKEYLSGSDGVARAGICLQYMLFQNKHFGSVEEMYQFFCTTDAVKLLKKTRLYTVCSDLFDYPIDYLHESLPSYQKDEFLYRFYKFQLCYSEFLKKEKRQRKKQMAEEKRLAKLARAGGDAV